MRNADEQFASAWTLALLLAACTGRDTDLSTSALTVVAADLHLHHVCPAGRFSSAELLARMDREDIQVGAVLIAAQNFAESVDRFDGRDDPASRPNRILHDDLEISGFPAAGFGHLVLLGLESLRFSDGDPLASPHTLRPVMEWAPPRTVIGYAHGWAWPTEGYPRPGAHGIASCCIPFSFPVDLTTGRVAFLAEEFADHNARGVTTFTCARWRKERPTPPPSSGSAASANARSRATTRRSASSSLASTKRVASTAIKVPHREMIPSCGALVLGSAACQLPPAARKHRASPKRSSQG